jgi:ethanolamine utilization protein EutQ (cupin superfamily)
MEEDYQGENKRGGDKMPCYIVREEEAKKLGHVNLLGKVNKKAHLSQAIKSPASGNMTAGYIRLDPGYFREVESPVDEIDFFIEGTLTYSFDGQTFTAQKGDIVFVKKGTKARFSTDEGCFAFYVTYPLFQETIDALAKKMGR